jgi:hypothetical protein
MTIPASVPFSYFAASYFSGSYFGALVSGAAAPDPWALLGQAVQVVGAPGSAGFGPLTGVIDSVVLASPTGPSMRLSVTITP